MAGEEKKAKYLTNSDMTAMLPKATAEKYKVVNLNKRTTGAFVHAKYGAINFKTLSLAKASQLLKLKFPYLEAKK